jgi:hypothetical protein
VRAETRATGSEAFSLPAVSDVDEGYITFSSNQELVIVPEVRDKLLETRGHRCRRACGDFTREEAYLNYHRANVFKHTLSGRLR